MHIKAKFVDIVGAEVRTAQARFQNLHSAPPKTPGPHGPGVPEVSETSGRSWSIVRCGSCPDACVQ